MCYERKTILPSLTVNSLVAEYMQFPKVGIVTLLNIYRMLHAFCVFDIHSLNGNFICDALKCVIFTDVNNLMIEYM